jgi:hypothetical protein
MERRRTILSLVAGAALATAAWAGLADARPAQVGDVVWAQWTPNAWYHGRTDGVCAGGLHIQFDDGDKACRNRALIAVDAAPGAVGKGDRVLAPWKNGKLYPGTVGDLVGPARFRIHFDDGDVGHSHIGGLRLIGR